MYRIIFTVIFAAILFHGAMESTESAREKLVTRNAITASY